MAEPATQMDVKAPVALDDMCDCVHPQAVAAARDAIAAATGLPDAAAMMSILGDPTRLLVLTALRHGELCVGDLAAATGVNRSTVSHQLRILRAHDLVRRRREGRTIFYAISDDHVVSILEMTLAHADERRPVDRRLA